jgi:uncharacterized membrane protein
MEKYNRLWRSFFATGLIAIAVQQIICKDFRPVIIPPGYPAWLADRIAWTWVFSLALIAACAAILFEFEVRKISLSMAGIFLLMVLLFQVPGTISGPFHLGSWTNPFKELTFSGGAFIVAGTFQHTGSYPWVIRLLEKLIPAGKYFLAFTVALFGFMHFVYLDFVASLVPGWIPGHVFWAQFAGVALMAAGLGIILNIQRRLAALLLGIMLFIWVIILHIPLAIADPHSGDGNQWTSVFEAFAYSGLAFILAGKQEKKIFPYF